MREYKMRRPARARMFPVYPDLDQLHKRLTRWVGAHVPLLDVQDCEEGRACTVVEARPARVTSLALPPCKARWSRVIPDSHISSDSRHWFIKKTIKHQTRLEDEAEDVSPSLPPGLTFWSHTEAAKGLMLLAKHDLNALFATEQERSPVDRILYNENVLDGTYALFDAAGEPLILYKDAIHLLSQEYSALTRLYHEYAKMACTMYGTSMRQFARTTRVCVTRYAEGGGEPLALLPFARFDRGPVMCVFLGEDNACLDVSPVLLEADCCPTRIHVYEGTLIVIDGRARLLCAFGVPTGPSPRYRLTFYLAMDNAKVMDYSRDLCSPILLTPMRKSGVVTSQRLDDTRRLDTVYSTACETSVHSLHEVLAELESHACIMTKHSRFQRSHHR